MWLIGSVLLDCATEEGLQQWFMPIARMLAGHLSDFQLKEALKHLSHYDGQLEETHQLVFQISEIRS